MTHRTKLEQEQAEALRLIASSPARRRAPGTTRHWKESWYPVCDEGGEIIGFSAVVVDITERKQAEAALRHTNECFELAVKASKVVLFQQDLKLRYRWIRNPVPGFDSAEVVGKAAGNPHSRPERGPTFRSAGGTHARCRRPHLRGHLCGQRHHRTQARGGGAA